MLKFLGNSLKKLSINHIVYLILAALIVFLLVKLYNFSDKLERQSARISSLSDSTRHVSEGGETFALQQGIIAQNERDLKRVNADLDRVLTALKGQALAAIYVEGEARVESVYTHNNLVTTIISPDSSLNTLTWNLNNPHYSIGGSSSFYKVNNNLIPNITTIDSMVIPLNLVVGMRERRNQYELFANSTNPYIHIDRLEGGVIKKKRKNYSVFVGPSVGAGVGTSTGQIQPYIGVSAGVGFSLIRF